MENTNIQSALEVLNNPEAIYKHLTGTEIPEGETVPTLTLEDEALTAELLVTLADEISENDTTFNTAYKAIQEKNEVVTRSGLGEILPYISKAHQLVSDNWVYIFFLIQYLNNSGKLDKLKNHPKLKTFFKTLLEE